MAKGREIFRRPFLLDQTDFLHPWKVPKDTLEKQPGISAVASPIRPGEQGSICLVERIVQHTSSCGPSRAWSRRRPLLLLPNRQKGDSVRHSCIHKLWLELWVTFDRARQGFPLLNLICSALLMPRAEITRRITPQNLPFFFFSDKSGVTGEERHTQRAVVFIDSHDQCN